MDKMFSEDELKFLKDQERKMQLIMKLVVPVGDSTYDKLRNDMGNEYLQSVLELCNAVMAFCTGFLIDGVEDEENEIQ